MKFNIFGGNLVLYPETEAEKCQLEFLVKQLDASKAKHHVTRLLELVSVHIPVIKKLNESRNRF